MGGEKRDDSLGGENYALGMNVRRSLISPVVAVLVLLTLGACGNSGEVAAPANREAADSEPTVMSTRLCIWRGASAGPMTVQFSNHVNNPGTNLDYEQCGRTRDTEWNIRTTLVAEIFNSSGTKVMELQGSNPQFDYPFVTVLGGGKEYEYEYAVGDVKTYNIDGYSVNIERVRDFENAKQFRVSIN